VEYGEWPIEGHGNIYREDKLIKSMFLLMFGNNNKYQTADGNCRKAVLYAHKGNMAFSQKGRMCDLKAMEKTLKRFDYEVKIDVLV